MREMLEQARPAGLDFDTAWELSWEAIVWPDSRREADNWAEALASGREGWRAAYEGWPPEPRESACKVLSRIFSEDLLAA
jgi:hypothetical protein